jgi:cold shock CspA family protein
LYSFVNALPTTEIENYKSLVKALIKKYEKQIALTHLCHKAIARYADKFDDNSFNHMLDYEISGDKKIGNVSKGKTEVNFVFIESDSERIYANRYDFIDCSNWLDWKNLQNGQLVSYEVGTNPQGECAKNIKLININNK